MLIDNGTALGPSFSIDASIEHIYISIDSVFIDLKLLSNKNTWETSNAEADLIPSQRPTHHSTHSPVRLLHPRLNQQVRPLLFIHATYVFPKSTPEADI